MSFSQRQVNELLKDRDSLATLKTLIALGVMKRCISRSKAEKKYGQALVAKWLADGDIKAIKRKHDNSPFELDVLELEAAYLSIKSIYA